MTKTEMLDLALKLKQFKEHASKDLNLKQLLEPMNINLVISSVQVAAKYTGEHTKGGTSVEQL